MLEYLEVHKIDPKYEWIEIKAADEKNQGATIIRLMINEAREMSVTFTKRYLAKRDQPVTVPEQQARAIQEFFEEVSMTAILARHEKASPDLVELLPTTTIHFKYPERTSFRRSRAARIELFRDQGFAALQRHRYEEAMGRFEWIHQLDPNNEIGFEFKVVCLRTQKKMAECVSVFEQWIQAHPSQVEPRLGIAEMWLYLDQNQRARDSFKTILDMAPNHVMALLGMAQAKIKLGENPLPELRKAWIIDQDYTKDLVENRFDFREAHAKDLRPQTLMEISKSFRIPIKRVMVRASKGVQPIHPPEHEAGLLRFSKKDLDLHYEVLRVLGLEIATGTQTQLPSRDLPETNQPGLFDGG